MGNGVAAVRAHLRALWPGWTWLAIIPLAAYPFVKLATGGFRWDHGAFLAAVTVLPLAARWTKKIYVGAYPIAVVAILYESMGLVRNVGLTQDNVHVCDLRDAEMSVFGVSVDGVPGTVHDWFQAHPSPVIDALCAVPYGTFIFVCVGFALYAYVKDFPRMQRFTWAFLLMNVAGFVTYHLYPAAPPWYFHAHGCEVDLLAHASEGANLARVDEAMGFHYFGAMYGRSSDVFGAVPSLHVAYPTLVLLEGWALFGKKMRAATIVFVLWMAFSAVYLDHHWILDVLLGLAYAVFGLGLMRLAVRAYRAMKDRATRPAPRDALAYVLATWFGAGLVPLAPGTAGSVAAIPLYLALRAQGPLVVLVAAVVVTFVGVWAASSVARQLGQKDPQRVVIDEVAGMLFTLAAAPAAGWQAVVVGFVLFRVCDQFKPWPARLAERRLPGGWGIVFDDVFAGAWAAAGVGVLRVGGVL